MTKTPSYIVLRKEIYYFQIRIPANITHSKLPTNKLFRRSTKTGNRREAMRIARQWWVQVMADDFFEKNHPELAEAEQDNSNHKNLVDRGRVILEEFRKSGIDENDYLAVDDFLQHYTVDDIKAFHIAKEYLESIQTPKVDTSPTNVPISPHLVGGSPIPLMEVLEKWIHYNTETRKGGKPWSNSSRKKFIPNVKLMIDMVGNPSANLFTKALLRDEFSNKLQLLPTSLRQRDLFKVFDKSGKKTERLKPFNEIIELADEYEVKTFSSKTIQDYARTNTRFLKWARKNDYTPSGVELETVLEHWLEYATEDDRRRAFDESDLKKLFETEEYRKGLLFDNPYRHWVPLIALYTGCRSGEASQLCVEDIKKEEGTGIWYFDFVKGEGQTLKSKESKRKVPIHGDLKKLGFFTYVEQQKGAGKKQLFSQLSADSIGHWGGLIGRWLD